MVVAASAVSVMSGESSAVSAGLSPGFTRSSCTSVGAAPERVTSSASTPVLGPVHSGSVPPRASGVVSASAPASSTVSCVQSPQAPASSCTRTCTTVSVTAASAAQVTPTSEKSSVRVSVTVRTGSVGATPPTGSVVPCSTSAAGAGSSTEPMAICSVEVSTGSASGPGAALTGTTRTVAVMASHATVQATTRRAEVVTGR